MIKVYLAFYKGRKSGNELSDKITRLFESATRFFTHGKYSHVELVIPDVEGTCVCYSSSMRDGGVRKKVMTLDLDKWDLLEVKASTRDIEYYYSNTENCNYDLRGALGCVFPSRESSRKYFCSEWCFNAITGSKDGWRFSPNDLFVLANNSAIKRDQA